MVGSGSPVEPAALPEKNQQAHQRHSDQERSAKVQNIRADGGGVDAGDLDRTKPTMNGETARLCATNGS